MGRGRKPKEYGETLVCRSCKEEKKLDLFPFRYWGKNKRVFYLTECFACASLRVIRLRSEKMPLAELEERITRDLEILKVRTEVLAKRSFLEKTSQ